MTKVLKIVLMFAQIVTIFLPIATYAVDVDQQYVDLESRIELYKELKPALKDDNCIYGGAIAAYLAAGYTVDNILITAYREYERGFVTARGTIPDKLGSITLNFTLFLDQRMAYADRVCELATTIA